MKASDKKEFALLIAGVYAYHRQPCSDALIGMYWRGCQQWSFDQVQIAVDRLTRDAEAGKFPPKIGDLTRVLEGTHSDRATLAWGKALGAMQSVGAYADVVFDDPAIHAVIEDLGGWPKVCRTETKALGYLQHQFCEGHRAYVGRGSFEYPRRLNGHRDPDGDYTRRGLKPPEPVLVGDVDRAREVFHGGNVSGKQVITFNAPLTLAGLAANAEQREGVAA